MAEPLLEARDLVKNYGHVRALDGASFTVYPGEVVALIGDNGAGKSTLVKVLSGAIRPDSGEVRISGQPVHLSSPLDARASRRSIRTSPWPRTWTRRPTCTWAGSSTSSRSCGSSTGRRCGARR